MLPGAEERRHKRHRLNLTLVAAFGLLAGVGFAGIFWTVEGAPGHPYYWTLRLPITTCALVGGSGLFFSSIPFLMKLTSRSTPQTAAAAETEEELEARAKHLCSLLPLVESARWKTTLMLLLLLGGFIAGGWWGLRTGRPVLVVLCPTAALVMLWQVTRSFIFRVEFYPDRIRSALFAARRIGGMKTS